MAKIQTQLQKNRAPYTRGAADYFADGDGKKKGGSTKAASKTVKGKKPAFAKGGMVKGKKGC